MFIFFVFCMRYLATGKHPHLDYNNVLGHEIALALACVSCFSRDPPLADVTISGSPKICLAPVLWCARKQVGIEA